MIVLEEIDETDDEYPEGHATILGELTELEIPEQCVPPTGKASRGEEKTSLNEYSILEN